jgi:hypothetical protein
MLGPFKCIKDFFYDASSLSLSIPMLGSFSMDSACRFMLSVISGEETQLHVKAQNLIETVMRIRRSVLVAKMNCLKAFAKAGNLCH